jgi:oxaloacetate decarboxylase alpha subunit
MPQIKVVDTTLRDAQQSLMATRMATAEMLPIVEKIDDIGYHALEVWGGATFDSCLRYLNEDPWDRLRAIRLKVKKSKLQMLFRGQNILGYRNYSDDVVSYFVEKSIANGIDIIRLFDALNDVRNLKTAIDAVRREKGHAQVAISYTLSPVHSLENYVRLAKQFEESGADSIGIKDMAGLLQPYTAYELVKAIKENVKLPVELHSHCTTGLAPMAYIKAIDAGVDIIDCATAPFAMGTSQPAIETIVDALNGTEYSTGFSLTKLDEIDKYFSAIRDKYISEGVLDPKELGVDAKCLVAHVPGGMLSNLRSQLKAMEMSDIYDEVLAEIPSVRKDCGYPPLVTPTSQIVGSQAMLNVAAGERYEMVSNEFRALLKGEYGATPAPIDEEFRKSILGDEEPITCRPADLLEPELPKLREAIKDYIIQDEDVLSYALFDQVALQFFAARKNP